MQEKISTLNIYGEKLVGLVDFPKSQNDKLSAIILVHGFGAEKTEKGMFDDIAQILSENKFFAYRFDFSGLGESEGDYSKTTLTKLTEDLRAIIDFVKFKPRVNPSKIGILGMSFGVSVAVALNAPEIQTYVLLGSVAHPYEVLKNLFMEYTFNPNGISFRITSEGKHIKMGPQFWKDFQKYDLLKIISEIHKPICIIHGEKDSAAPLAEAKIFYEAANEPKKLIIVKNADHGFYEPNERKQMVTEAVNWFRNHLS
jgi:putative redox protein